MPLITVLTPTYNRASLLPRLYESLCRQTYKDFEWIVVDDGSTDDTEELVNSKFKTYNTLFPVRYFKKKNGGKHTAINYGVRKATGILFYIVDSDDYLTDDSLSWIAKYYEGVKDDKSFCGVSGMKGYFNGDKVGTQVHFDTLDCTIAESGYKYHIHGDKAEIFKTSVMKEFPFPEFPDERFCPEALVWNRMSKKYKMRYFDKVIYICEYLKDGLSHNQSKLLGKNIKATMLTYKEMVENSEAPLFFRLRSAINYWRYSLLCPLRYNKGFRLKWHWMFLLPIGIMVRIIKG